MKNSCGTSASMVITTTVTLRDISQTWRDNYWENATYTLCTCILAALPKLRTTWPFQETEELYIFTCKLDSRKEVYRLCSSSIKNWESVFTQSSECCKLVPFQNYMPHHAQIYKATASSPWNHAGSTCLGPNFMFLNTLHKGIINKKYLWQ